MSEPLTQIDQSSPDLTSQSPTTDRLRSSRPANLFYQLLAPRLSQFQVQVIHGQSFLRSSMVGVCAWRSTEDPSIGSLSSRSTRTGWNYAEVPVRGQEASIDMSRWVAFSNTCMPVSSFLMAWMTITRGKVEGLCRRCQRNYRVTGIQ